MNELSIGREGIIRAVERYMGRMFGLPIAGTSFSAFNEALLEGVAPFAKGCLALELRTKEGVFRAVAPGQAAGALTFPLDELPGNRMEISILIPEKFPDTYGGEKIASDAVVEGGNRMPSRDCAYGVRVDGRFVSWACAADYGDVMYITVETSPAYRGKGYAKDALRAITAQLLKEGHAPVYFTETGNTASIKTAYASGYAEYGMLTRIV